jgi:acyl-CoA synthetase (NDP forming)
MYAGQMGESARGRISPDAARCGPHGLDLTPLFAPQSIAVVGASPDLGKPGGRCVAYLSQVGYPGRVYPVNPRYEEIGGLRAYASIESLPEPPDLAVFIIPAHAVVEAIGIAGEYGVRAAVVCSSGFAESGPEGRELENRLADAAGQSGMAILGPNCLGYFDAHAGVAATFTTALQLQTDAPAGRIAFVSQSGALGAGIFSVGRRAHAGLGMFVSTGNETCLGVAEVLRHLASDDEVGTILTYVEGVSDGRELVAAAREVRERGKRVVTIKVGRTDAGMRASRSHTGALAGSARVWDAALRRGGVIAVDTMQQLLDVGIALDAWPGDVGPRLGVVSMSGGAAALMADRAAEGGLEVPPLSAATRQRLQEVLPPFAGMDNPVDYGAVYGDLDAIEHVVRTVAAAPEIDLVAVFIGLTPEYVGQLEDRLARIAAEVAKPLLVSWLGAPASALAELRDRGVAAYDDPSRAVDAAAALAQAAAPLPSNASASPGAPGPAKAELERLCANGTTGVPEATMKALLAGAGAPIVREHLATTAEAAAEFARGLPHTVAVKVDADGLLHKTDIGGVELDVGHDDVKNAYARVTAAGADAGYTVRGAVVSQMAAPGAELIVGTRWDEQFGATILVGAGGVTAELLSDVRVELAPVTVDQAREMVRSLRTSPLLTGYRGDVPRDVEAVAELITDVSHFAAEAGEVLAELDLNPVVVYPEGEGCLILDAAAVLAQR